MLCGSSAEGRSVTSIRRALATAVLLIATAAAGCGGGTFDFPDIRREDFPPVRTTILNLPFELAPGASATFDFQITESAEVVATIDWTRASNEVAAVFASRSCPSVNHALAGSCFQGVLSTRPSTCPAKPRVIGAYAVGGVPLRLYVANTGPAAESGRVQVTACRDAPGCAAGNACGQCNFDRQLESCR
jgi:hypothetical protein